MSVKFVIKLKESHDANSQTENHKLVLPTLNGETFNLANEIS